MAVTGIAFTVYPASDVDRSVAFYRDLLGREPETHVPGSFAEFAIDGAWFSLVGPQITSTKPGSAHALALEVHSVADESARLTQAGTTVGARVETQVCFLAHVTDPDGNTVLLHESKPQSATGSV
jgi:predicted enzyme related to lactoylglutathione lyase